MPDIVTALKAEIQRIARKEIRAQTESIRKASVLHRREIAALKRQVKALEQANTALRKTAATKGKASTPEAPARLRFSAKGLKSHRERLGLSADSLGKLLGVSGQSIYNWEQQKTVPRAEQLKAMAALRSLSRKEAQAALTETARNATTKGGD
jgi:DNA-binding transcriptional regulator YiaG